MSRFMTILEKPSYPEIILIQQSQGIQTDLPNTPPWYPHPITITTQVQEHFSNPKDFLGVFHHSLKTLYATIPHHPQRPTLDVFKENPPRLSAPAIPRPKGVFTQGSNLSLEDSLLLCQLLNDQELDIPILTYCQPGSPLLTLYWAYQANWQLKNIQASDHIIHEQEINLVNAFYCLKGFQFLQELHYLPTQYFSSKEAFCITCYHKGHYQQHYVHYQCFSCLWCGVWNQV